MNYAIQAQNDFSYQPMPFLEDHAMTSNYSRKLDLNLYCIKRPQQTCFIRVTNPDMLAWGIEQGDILVVEKSESLTVGDLVVIENRNKMDIYEFVTHNNGEFVLFSLSAKAANIKTHNLTDLNIVGVVTNTIHQVKPRRDTMKFVA
ncbi:S24 family peptidase [Bisgaard Taxon 10/6]|uniref:LexA family protein n=1 Tax=Exercitatus varius TaxID=67857 RepID=UPI00294B1427|nr:S24 family peptidase [Exercitatus varius]MDG2953255.1 S24 family peptidase [Exercitatus varius]